MSASVAQGTRALTAAHPSELRGFDVWVGTRQRLDLRELAQADLVVVLTLLFLGCAHWVLSSKNA
jgi:hypothetical protein